MRWLITKVGLALCCLGGCNHSNSFDQKAWVENTEMSDTHNPRARMVKDLMQHHLKPGMTRKDVLTLLGTPYEEGVQQRMPRGKTIPDSISQVAIKALPENKQKALDRFNAYYKAHSQPDTLMLYPVGWSIIDPNFLAIRFDSKGQVREYWVEEH